MEVLLLICILGIPMYFIIRDWLSKIDRTEWLPGARPNIDAKIVNIYTEEVQYVKNGKNLKQQ